MYMYKKKETNYCIYSNKCKNANQEKNGRYNSHTRNDKNRMNATK